MGPRAFLQLATFEVPWLLGPLATRAFSVRALCARARTRRLAPRARYRRHAGPAPQPQLLENPAPAAVAARGPYAPAPSASPLPTALSARAAPPTRRCALRGSIAVHPKRGTAFASPAM